MVQLSAASLGVPTNNVQASIADAITQATQGLVQGMKLKALQDSQAREALTFQQGQEDRTRMLGERDAAKQASGLLAEEFQPPNATEAIRGATESLWGQNPISSGFMSSARPLGQKADWQALQKHHQDIMARAAAIAPTLDPKIAPGFIEATKQSLREDAQLLRRSHVVGGAQDALVGGAFDPPNPVDGAPMPDEGIRAKVSEIMQGVETGTIDPEQGSQQLQGIRETATRARTEIRQRKRIVEQARQSLKESGQVPSDEAEQMLDMYDTAQIDRPTFEAAWPHLLRGEVQYQSQMEKMPPIWVTPDQVPVLRQYEQGLRQAEIDLKKAQAAYQAQRPAIETAKVEGQNARSQAAIDARSAAQNQDLQFRREKLASEEKRATESNQAKAEAASKSATETGFSDQKAYAKAVELAKDELSKGAIEQEGYEARIKTHYEKLVKQKPTDQTDLIDTIIRENPTWTKDQIKAEVKKRGG